MQEKEFVHVGRYRFRIDKIVCDGLVQDSTASDKRYAFVVTVNDRGDDAYILTRKEYHRYEEALRHRTRFGFDDSSGTSQESTEEGSFVAAGQCLRRHFPESFRREL